MRKIVRFLVLSLLLATGFSLTVEAKSSVDRSANWVWYTSNDASVARRLQIGWKKADAVTPWQYGGRNWKYLLLKSKGASETVNQPTRVQLAAHSRLATEGSLSNIETRITAVPTTAMIDRVLGPYAEFANEFVGPLARSPKGIVTNGPDAPRVRHGVKTSHNYYDWSGYEQISASQEGEVVEAGFFAGLGKTALILHKKDDQPPVFTLYAHMSRLDVTVGQHVGKKQVIGLIGHTGQARGNNCHWGILRGYQIVEFRAKAKRTGKIHRVLVINKDDRFSKEQMTYLVTDDTKLAPTRVNKRRHHHR